MHEAYWGLTEQPFSLTPDPRFMFLSRSHEDALMMLHYAVMRNKGAAMLTGEVGLGKTTVSRKLVGMLDPTRYRFVTLPIPEMTPIQVLREILDQLGLPSTSRNRPALQEKLHEGLIELHEKDGQAILLIDEAQEIGNTATMDELRSLLNHQVDDEFLMTVILVGQPEMKAKLAKVPELEQRLAVRYHLRPMDVSEVGGMLFHRLCEAGFSRERSPFTPDAVLEMHKASQGSPRMVCQLADTALLMGMVHKVQQIDGFLMHSVVAEFFGEEELAA